MKNFKDFSLITPFTTYINNQKYIFSFLVNKILVSIEEDYLIYNNRSLIFETINYENYMECFKAVINELNNLYFCKICKKFDKNDCNVCKLNNIIDELSVKKIRECIVCYNELTVRYASLCNEEEHSLCMNCYDKIYYDSKICPYCRQTNHNEEDI